MELTMIKRKSAITKTANTATDGTARNGRPSRKPKTKLAQLEAMLRRPDGATIEQISKSLVWQAHSVRGAMSGALKKKQGLTITNEKTDDGRRVYRIA
jgi:transposase